MKIAIQLYSVREFTRTREELEATLEKIAAAGYKYVETAGFYGMTAAELKELLARYGLTVISAHVGIEAVTRGLDQLIADLKTFGATEVCVPGIPADFFPHNVVGYTCFAEVMETAAKKLKAEGIQLSYHNHDHEFNRVGVAQGMNYLYGNMPSVNMQLDAGNCRAAGATPEYWAEFYNDRISTIHYKDVIFIDGVRHDPAIGEGLVNWQVLSDLVKKSACEYVIVEIEEFLRDPWEICETSYKNIEGWFAE